MSRCAAIAALLAGIALGLGGCLLSPQPEPPDVIDDDYPDGFTRVDPSSGAVPDEDGGCDDETDTSGDCGFSGGEEPPCGCQDGVPGDCGRDEPGPTAAERDRLYLSPDDVAAMAGDRGPDDDPVAASP